MLEETSGSRDELTFAGGGNVCTSSIGSDLPIRQAGAALPHLLVSPREGHGVENYDQQHRRSTTIDHNGE